MSQPRHFRPVLAAILAFGLCLAPNPAPAQGPGLAADLEQARRLLAIDWREQPELYYEPLCDRPRAAAEIYERLTLADPSLTRAWLGWGRAVERAELCPAGTPANQFLTLLGLDHRYPRRDETPDPSPAQRAAVLAAAELAAEKYRQAAELAPADVEILTTWAGVLFKAARLTEDSDRGRELAAEADRLYARALEAAATPPEQAYINKHWGFNLARLALALKEGWEEPLAEAGAKLDQYIRLSPAKSDPVPPATRRVTSRTAACQATAEFVKLQAESLDEADRVKKKAFLRAGTERYQTEEIASLHRNLDYETRELNQLRLDLALLEDDPEVWRGLVELVETETGIPPANPEARSAVDWLRDYWWRYLDKEKDPARRAVILGKIEKIVAGLTPGPILQTRDEGHQIINREELHRLVALLRLALLRPDGPERDQAVTKAEADFETALSEVDGFLKSILYQAWGGTYWRLALSEASDERARALIDQALDKYRQSDETKGLGEASFPTWLSSAEHGAFQEKDPARRKMLWESILKGYAQYSPAPRPFSCLGQAEECRAVGPRPLPFTFMGQDEYFRQLSDLNFKMALSLVPETAERMMMIIEGLRGRQHLAETAEREPFSLMILTADARYEFAQALAFWAFEFDNHDPAESLPEAMRQYRRYFSELPNRLVWYGPIPAGREGQSYQNHLTGLIAPKVRGIYQVLVGRDLTPRVKIQMAGLHRYLAASGLVAPHYQKLYWREAEDLLRQALAEIIPLAGPPSPIVPLPDADQERALALAELALVIYERGGPGRPVGAETDEALEEAEKLLDEAEALRPGSSRYTRARLAAWRGETDRVREYIRHGQADLYPPFEEAAGDPALAEVAGAAWFKRVWYGFDAR